jgi:thiol:disulfide interchange protein DsbD
MRIAPSRPLPLSGCALVVAALIGFVFVIPRPAHSADAKPAKKDSNPRIKPKEVTLTPSVKPTEARAGETVTYQVSAKLDPGWHIYTYTKEPQGQGPRNTTFDFFDTAGLKPAGDWTASKKALSKKEPAFDNLVVESYEDEVTWSIPLLIPPGTEPSKKTLRCQVGYQICDASRCKIPGQWTLPDVVLTVLPGGAAAGAPVVEVVKPTPAVPASSTSSTGQVSEVAKKAQLGLWPFLLCSALGGLGALVMPCVWPMVPITVNFFVKQGHANKGKTTGLAITYCLAIIGIFTSFGVLCSFFFSAAALQNLANNGWLNAFIAVLFLAFGLSLLGLFEIRLPNFLLNASAQGESRGGLVGVIFMAMTLTITSFTCTFPVVGGLIVMAAGGQFFYPIIGLATFSTVLALPFFLLALSPGLLSKMPRSGDWMNAVKVVGGLIEIGAAFKFVNTAEIGFGALPKDAWFDAQVVLTIWVVLALVCGVYLLGLFRTDHDHDEAKVGPGRLLIGTLLLILALFLAPALFGRPPQSKIWYWIVGILPADVQELNPVGAVVGPAGESGEVPAVSKDPEQAEREQTNFHGVVWGMSYDAAREKAKTENRPILIDFTGVNCANCRTMEQGVMPLPEVVKLLKKFITVQLYTDIVPIGSINMDQRLELAEKNQKLLVDLTQDNANPFYVAITPDGQILDSINGARSASVFIDFLNRALNKHQGPGQVAQIAPAH